MKEKTFMKHPKHYETDESTSKRMANVKLKQGKAEVTLAKALWHKGFRYRLNYKKLPGSPDIAIQNFILLSLLMENFGMAMIGKIRNKN